MVKAAAVKTTTAAKPAAKTAPQAAAKPAATAAKPAVKASAKPPATPTSAPAAKAAKAAKPAAKASKAVAAKPKSAAKASVSKGAAKPAPKSVAKAAPKKVVKAAPAAANSDPVKLDGAVAESGREKGSKGKLVRDSFTMPETEYALLGQVKKACLKAGFEIKKSELLRIGVALISQMDTATLQKVLDGLPQLKTGRPKNV